MKQRLQYTGRRPLRLILNNVRHDLRRGDVIEIDLKKFSGNRIKRFVNLTEKEREDEVRSREIELLIKEVEKIR